MAFMLQATELTPFCPMLGGLGSRGTPYDLSWMMLFPLLGLGFSLTCCVGGLTLTTGGVASTESPAASSQLDLFSSTSSFTSLLSSSLGLLSPPGEVSTLAGLVGRRSVCRSAGVGGALEARGGGSPATREEAGMAISFPSEVWTRTNLPVILAGPAEVVFPPPSASYELINEKLQF